MSVEAQPTAGTLTRTATGLTSLSRGAVLGLSVSVSLALVSQVASAVDFVRKGESAKPLFDDWLVVLLAYMGLWGAGIGAVLGLLWHWRPGRSPVQRRTPTSATRTLLVAGLVPFALLLVLLALAVVSWSWP